MAFQLSRRHSNSPNGIPTLPMALQLSLRIINPLLADHQPSPRRQSTLSLLSTNPLFAINLPTPHKQTTVFSLMINPLFTVNEPFLPRQSTHPCRQPTFSSQTINPFLMDNHPSRHGRHRHHFMGPPPAHQFSTSSSTLQRHGF